jgi:hypothetical protein
VTPEAFGASGVSNGSAWALSIPHTTPGRGTDLFLPSAPDGPHRRRRSPVGRERDRPGVEDGVIVGENQHPDDHEGKTGCALDDWNDSLVGFDEFQEDAERECGEEKRGSEPRGIGDEETDAALHSLGGTRERE